MIQKKVSQKWPIILFTIGVFMAGLDNGIISAALTTIYSSFGVTPAWGAWTVTLYTLGIAISVPIVGKLSDNYGRRRLFLIEIFLFGVGSLLVALSPNFTWLLVARFIQAIGGGGIFIIGTSHILSTIPKHQQGKMLGMLGGMHGLSAVIGPNLGSVILRVTDTWQWMFLINIPIVLFLLVMGAMTIKETKSPTNKPLDISGSVLLSTGIVLLMLGLTNLNAQQFVQSFFSLHVGLFVVLGVIILLMFLKHERGLELQGGDPIISFRLLSGKHFQMTLLLGFLSGGFLSCIIFIPSYVQQVLQVPAENAGFWLTPLALASGVGAGLGGYLTDKIGATKTIITSGIIGLFGFLTFYMFVDSFSTFLLASILAGVGLGFLLGAPLNVLISEGVREDQYGTSLGTLSLTRQVGLTLFPTLFASFIASGVLKIKPEITTFGMGIDVKELIPDYGEIITYIQGLDDVLLQNQLKIVVAKVMREGFNAIFLTAFAISIIVIGLGIYLHIIRKKWQTEK